MFTLGLSAYYHDSAAALLKDGDIVAAAQEERFSRKKHDARFPVNALNYCLAEAGISLSQVDQVAFYEKPFLKFERLLETYHAFAPRGFKSFRMAIPLWLHEKLYQKNLLTKELMKIEPRVNWVDRLLFSEHHLSHAASAFFPSPFDEALVLTMDGVGEWTTTSAAIGRGKTLEIFKEIHFPHSLGLLYSAFTYYLGFKVNSGEYKVMGLAPYGEPKYAQTILDHIIDLKPDGSYRLDQSYFDYCTGLTMTNAKFDCLFGGPPRKPDDLLTQREMDLAASVQAVTEEAMLRMTRALRKETGLENLCLAGGVALNCVANGKVLRDGQFKRIWVQPAAGDAGGALGAALAVHYLHCDQPAGVGWRRRSGQDSMSGSYLGPIYAQSDIEARLTALGARFSVLLDTDMIERTASLLATENVVGWFQGRMEFGPRALGGRSILGDPRSAKMQSVLNLKIKYRESFRPFAPSVLSEHVADWFDLDLDSPYMLIVSDVLIKHRIDADSADLGLFGIEKLKVPRSSIPAVTHVDYSARIQTVHADTNPRYHALISSFHEKTGCPMLINTSFNVRGEPIVCTPEDAFRCFMGTEMDALVIGNCLLMKAEQDLGQHLDYKNMFELD
jgi:carbamoyltransferase